MSFLKEGPVSLIARLVRSEPLVNESLVLPNANRVAFEFDSIDSTMDAEEALKTIADEADRSRLAILKILTTADHFRYLADVGEFRDGQWYRIKLLPREKKRGPFAWASSLAGAGYEEIVPLVVEDIRYLFSEGDWPFRPVGAEVDSDLTLAQVIADACKFPKQAIGKKTAARLILNCIGRPHQIVVRDVGQASFCTAIDRSGTELFHLDAGWPVSWNMNTAPAKPKIKSGNTPIILSHWDWDHFHGYHAIAGLSHLVWIVPIQRLGPGAKLVALKLSKANRLLGISLAKLVAGPLWIGRCKSKAGNLNQTGLCVQVTLQSGSTVLFMGDADYDLAATKLTIIPDSIVATHHGAKFSGSVVSPRGGSGRCVVSVGKGNGYGHPSELSIKSHEKAGWSISYTCARHGLRRGRRHLGP